MTQREQSPYDDNFYLGQRDMSRRSAEIIIPEVLNLYPVQSACDVGCGVGAWVSVLLSCGVDAVGMDGAYVNPELLQIPKERFVAADLRKPLPKDRQFDLAISLEVAEHMEEAYAAQFVDSLTGIAPVVLFSAAIPLQKGLGHVNEQWQQYWVGLFGHHRYVPIDYIRRKVWSDPRIPPHYAQNIVLYCRADRLDNFPKLRSAADATCQETLSVVHPRHWEMYSRQINFDLGRDGYLSEVLRALPNVAWRAIRKRL